MIIEFSVKNFRSIKELQTISFVATKLDSNKDKYPEVDTNNIINCGEIKLLRTIGIYGANASGKSNIIRALDYFSRAVGTLPSPKSRLEKLADPFIYQENAEQTESFFQIVLLLEGKKYRYGFTVKKNTNKNNADDSREIITNEWLFGPKERNQTNYFTREDLKTTINIEGLKIPELKHKHTLLLTHIASYEKGICMDIWEEISGRIANTFSKGLDFYRYNTIHAIENDKQNLLDLFSKFGLHYADIKLNKDDDFNEDDIFPQNKIDLAKASFPNVRLNLYENESDGTKKFFDLAGLLYKSFHVLKSGIMILDELDSNFHPSLVIKLIELFNTPEINKKNIQFLFSSHDTNLLTPSLMRRDQFYFTEKDEQEATRLYSLADLKGIRNDADFAKQYLAGFYGALPFFKYNTSNN